MSLITHQNRQSYNLFLVRLARIETYLDDWQCCISLQIWWIVNYSHTTHWTGAKQIITRRRKAAWPRARVCVFLFCLDLTFSSPARIKYTHKLKWQIPCYKILNNNKMRQWSLNVDVLRDSSFETISDKLDSRILLWNSLSLCLFAGICHRSYRLSNWPEM